jgi:hypothetical protein
MKKIQPKSDPPADQQIQAQIIPIRTETVLSQFPLHRLSTGKEPVQVSIIKTNEQGKITTLWEVETSRKYGEPGALAYKLDALLINRLIDEMRPDIPEVIKLGSLREICKELGTERNTTAVKKALYQNAFAAITAKLEYTGNDGARHRFEFGSTRYGVVFAGETLPNGKVADAVYVVLNPIFREVLRYAKTRPLDYDYLKALPPASRRLYELLSFQIFAALKHDNQRAKYLYSDLCKFAPLTRYDNWDHVKKQLYKIHLPHRKSGYIADIEFKEIRDASGERDWIIWYIPGPKAHREYDEFTTRKFKASLPLQLMAPKSKKPGMEDAESYDQNTQRLIGYGVDRDVAARLVSSDPLECEQWADAWLFQNKDGMKNPPAVLRRFIEEKRRPFPKEYESGKRREERGRIEVSRERHKERYLATYHEYLQEQLKDLRKSNLETYTCFNKDFEIFAASVLQDGDPESRESLRCVEFERFANEHSELGILPFWDWDEAFNAAAFR